MAVDVQFHLQQLSTLRSERSNFDAQWEEAAARLIPAHRSTFFSQGKQTTYGQKNTELMFDATAALALMKFAAVMESLATPQGQMWHRLVPSDPSLRRNRTVRTYLDQVNTLLFRYRYRPTANFVGQMQSTYNSYGAYGNGTLFIDSFDEAPGLRYKNMQLGECYFIENHQGVVDGLKRSFRLKASQIVSMFSKPGDMVPESVRKAAANSAMSTTEYEIVHCVYRRADADPRRVDPKGMKYASVYIFVQENAVLRESGYRSWPAPLARYTQFSGEVYGRGPAQMVLPAIKVLNEQKKTVIKQGHRTVDPILLAHDDGAVGTFSMRPGAINPGGVSADGRALVQPLPVGNIAIGKELMDDERYVINDAFLITLFQILVEGGDRMTATEVLERVREKGMLIAPTTGRLQAEFLGPCVDRELDVLESQGLLPPPPAALVHAGGEYSLEYDAPMSRMARAENAAGFMRSVNFATEIVGITQDPSYLDHFAFDRAIPDILDINGSPTQWTASEDEVKKLREGRAAQQAAATAVEAAPAVASVAKTVVDSQ